MENVITFADASETLQQVITFANAALLFMGIALLLSPWLKGVGRFVALTIAAVLFMVLVLWSPATLGNAVTWLHDNWWWLILIIVECALGIVLKRDR